MDRLNAPSNLSLKINQSKWNSHSVIPISSNKISGTSTAYNILKMIRKYTTIQNYSSNPPNRDPFISSPSPIATTFWKKNRNKCSTNTSFNKTTDPSKSINLWSSSQPEYTQEKRLPPTPWRESSIFY